MSNAFTADVISESTKINQNQPPTGGYYIRKYLRLALDCLPKNVKLEGAIRTRITEALGYTKARLCSGCGEWRSECECDRRVD